MKRILSSKKLKEGTLRRKDMKSYDPKKWYEDERNQLKDISSKAASLGSSLESCVSASKQLSVTFCDWGRSNDAPLSTSLALVASFQTALGELQLKLAQSVEDKINNPLKDMMAMERDLIAASKKDDISRSEVMKVETFRMSLVQRLAEYLDGHMDFFQKGTALLKNYQDELAAASTQSRKQVEDILNNTLENDASEADAEALSTPLIIPPIFGVPLAETCKLDGCVIPRIVQHLIAFIDQNGLEQMGIFRISGHSGSVQQLKEEIDSGIEVDLTLQNNVHVLSTILKLYFRSLPDTLTIGSRFDEWTGPVMTEMAEKPVSEIPDSLIATLRSLVDSLPLNNAATFDFLISFCTRVAAKSEKNMMGAKNLASLIAPNILNRPDIPDAPGSPPKSSKLSPFAMLEDVSHANRIIEICILKYDQIFANVNYTLKSHPVQNLVELTQNIPLCADRSVVHGVPSMRIVPGAPLSSDSSDSIPGSHKKTLSSLSLTKDRKTLSKKKDKQTPTLTRPLSRFFGSPNSPNNSSIQSSLSARNMATQPIFEESGTTPPKQLLFAHGQSPERSAGALASSSSPSLARSNPISSGISQQQTPTILNLTLESSSTPREADAPIEPTTPSALTPRRRFTLRPSEANNLDMLDAFNSGPPTNPAILPDTSLGADALLDETSASLRGKSRRPSVLLHARSSLTTPIKRKSSEMAQIATTESPSSSTTTNFSITNITTAAPPTITIVTTESNTDNSGITSPRRMKPVPKEWTKSLRGLQFDQPNEFNTFMDTHFSKGGGEGSVGDFAKLLDEDQVQYGLLRFTDIEDGCTVTREAFIQWFGLKVTTLQKGIKKNHSGDIKYMLGSHCIDIIVSSLASFTAEKVSARCRDPGRTSPNLD